MFFCDLSKKKPLKLDIPQEWRMGSGLVIIFKQLGSDQPTILEYIFWRYILSE